MTRDNSTVTAIEAAGFVPVFNHDGPETAKAILDALGAGGATAVEFTNRSENAVAVFRELVEHNAAKQLGVVLGIGSVMDAEAANEFIAAGARFVVGPTTEPSVAEVCLASSVPYIPGCGTATEISRAHALGCDLIKVFPGDAAGGPSFVKAVSGPMPWVRLMPTGGVDITPDSLAAWFDAGVACVGLGSKLVSADIVDDGDWVTLTARTRKVREAIEAIRA